MDLYSQNMGVVKKFNPRLYDLLNSIEGEHFRIEQARSGYPTLIFQKDNQDFYIHSRFKPEEEAVNMVRKLNLSSEHFIILGLGLGYHLDLLLNAKPPHSRLLVIEPNFEIFKHSLHTLSWESIINREDFFLCLGNDLNTIASTIHNFIDITTFDTVETLELASEVRFEEKFFNSAKEIIDNEIRTLLYDFKTRLAEDAMVPRNILKNLRNILDTRPVKALKNRFRGVPGFIVSAGPSLDKNILYLKKMKDRGVIICVDTALKPLLKRDIHPHFTVTADPSYKNYLHLQGTENQIRYFLVSDTGISERVYKDFKEHLFSISLGKPILKMIEQQIGEIGEIEAWGSVISVALNLAIYMGLEPIVFLGQDFAFSGMRNHCRGTSWEEKWTEYSSDLENLQRSEKQSIGGISRVKEMPDIYGNPVMSSDKLMLYKNYLSKIFPTFSGKRFINATEGGILNEIVQAPLYQVMKDYVFLRPPIDFNALFQIPTLYSRENKNKLIAFFKVKLQFFKKYRNKVTNAITRLNEIDSASTFQARVILEEAHRVRNLLYVNPQDGEILEMWSQGPIFEFLKRTKKLERSGIPTENATEWGEVYKEYLGKILPLISSVIASMETCIKSLQGNEDRQ